MTTREINTYKKERNIERVEKHRKQRMFTLKLWWPTINILEKSRYSLFVFMLPWIICLYVYWAYKFSVSFPKREYDEADFLEQMTIWKNRNKNMNRQANFTRFFVLYLARDFRNKTDFSEETTNTKFIIANLLLPLLITIWMIGYFITLGQSLVDVLTFQSYK